MSTIQPDYRTVENALRLAGQVAEQARLKRTSLTELERNFINSVHKEANRLNISKQMQNTIEEEGAQTTRKAYVKSRFRRFLEVLS